MDVQSHIIIIAPKWEQTKHPSADKQINKNWYIEDFAGGPAVETLPSNAGGVGQTSGQEAKIPHVSHPKKQNMKQRQYCNKFNKGFFLMVQVKKNLKILVYSFNRILLSHERYKVLIDTHYNKNEP